MAANDDERDEEVRPDGESESDGRGDEEISLDETPEKDPFEDEDFLDVISEATDESEQEPANLAPDSDPGDEEIFEEEADGETERAEGADDEPDDLEESSEPSEEERRPSYTPAEGETLVGVSTTKTKSVEEQPDEVRSGDETNPDERQQPAETLITVENLRTYFYTKEGEVPAVDGVDFEIRKGETLGLVGESGSGKSVSALSILQLVPDPPGKIVDGEIRFRGQDLTELTDEEMRSIRGNDISMIFQEPMTSLNPVYTVGNQIVEAITLHQDVGYAEAREMAIGMLEKVGIPAPDERIDEYPHQMSGGMKQRVMIAMALACNPKLLIADEPTTALDVTIQAQILDLLQSLQDELDMSILFITHDLGVVAETCDYVAVMYGGRVVEYGDVETIFEYPSHPYTIGLLSSLPQVEIEAGRRRQDRLYVIPGMVPSPQNFPSGCRFRDRCDYATEKCAQLPEPAQLEEPGHESWCWYANEVRTDTKEKTGPFPEEDSNDVEAAE